ncbi:MAG: hypothetical protein ACREMY_16205, partial [bacterium]
FSDGPILTPNRDELKALRKAAKLDWSAIDPSVFGALVKRGMGSADEISVEDSLETLFPLSSLA